MHSIFDLFKIGIGPSSSHTVGPMIAAKRFVDEHLRDAAEVHAIRTELFGSLALTGRGHGTDGAIIGGLCGLVPAEVEPEHLSVCVARVRETGRMEIPSGKGVEFDESRHLVFEQRQTLPFHSNGIRFSAIDASGQTLAEAVYYSIGGGFVVSQEQVETAGRGDRADGPETPEVEFPFRSGEELLEICGRHSLSIDQVIDRNELTRFSRSEIDSRLDRLWQVMRESIRRGCEHEGVLPGGLNVRRRAPAIYRKLGIENLDAAATAVAEDPLRQLDFVSLFALAVNEENAAGGRVVTAPTNGAAGVIPAVLMCHIALGGGRDAETPRRFLKAAAAIGLLYQRNASLSAAEMGCQGEVGVACSMAAAGLAACLGGAPAQVANAAEIGMEHNLGLTCDPVRGLVQIPCIERNAVAAGKAISAARLAVLYGDGSHKVSLDRVIETMRQTGLDMKTKYKETSLGGLAVNVANC